MNGGRPGAPCDACGRYVYVGVMVKIVYPRRRVIRRYCGDCAATIDKAMTDLERARPVGRGA